MIENSKDLDEVFPLSVSAINKEFYNRAHITEPGLHAYFKNK